MPKLIQSFNFGSVSNQARRFITTTWQLKCWNSMHIHNNSVYCIIYIRPNMAVGLVIYFKARAFKAKAKSSRPRPRNLALRPRPRPRQRPRTNIPARMSLIACVMLSDVNLHYLTWPSMSHDRKDTDVNLIYRNDSQGRIGGNDVKHFQHVLH